MLRTWMPRIYHWPLLGRETRRKSTKRKLDRLGLIKAWSGLANSKYRIKRLENNLELADELSKVSNMYHSQRIKKKRKLLADMMDLAPKAAQKLWRKGGDRNKLYVTKIKAISFWFLYREVTGRKSTIVKTVSDLIEDNTEALEATN